MINLADTVVVGGVTLGFSAISWAAKALFARPRDEAAGRKDITDAFARERETWRQDYDHAYDQVKRQCEDCVQQLNKMQNSFYDLLDELEEQVAPMLLLPSADPKMTREAMITAIRKARKAVRPDRDSITGN